MGQLLTVVTLNKKSGLPADAVQNSFAWTTGSVPASPAEMDEIGNRIDNFYNAAGTAAVSISHYLSSSIDHNNNAHTVDFYDLTGHLNGTPHGSPIRSQPFTLAGLPDNTMMPDEVAICLSYHSAFGTDPEELGATRPKARDRGRLYIGPLALNTVVGDAVNQEPRVVPACAQTIRDAGVALNTSSVLATWCLWSRKDAALKPVTNVFVDNAFDIQRRRGNKATTRILG
jgi:hypothetical protein